MKEKNNTKSELKRIFDGMVYHMKELSEFMTTHLRDDDPYFETKEGTDMKKVCMNLTMTHLTGLLKLGAFSDLVPKENDKPNVMEEMLKNMIDED